MTSLQSGSIRNFNWFETGNNKEYFADFDKYWNEITNNLGKDLIVYLRDYLQKQQFVFAESNKFSVELVIDSNIIFSDILGRMKNKPSFLENIIDDPFLKLFAPPAIIDEVMKAIEEDLPKKLEKNKARNIAHAILSKITILEGRRLDAWVEAYNRIGKRDAKDVPFLALSFELETHGIITRDPDFSEQKEVRIWQVSQAGTMVSDFRKGSFSFFFMGAGLPMILQLCYWIFISFLKIVKEIMEGIFLFATIIVSGSFQLLSKIPPVVAIMALCSIGAILIFSGKVRDWTGGMLSKAGDKITKIINAIKKLFAKIVETIKHILEVLKPFISIAWKGVLYLFYSAGLLLARMNELEHQRARV